MSPDKWKTGVTACFGFQLLPMKQLVFSEKLKSLPSCADGLHRLRTGLFRRPKVLDVLGQVLILMHSVCAQSNILYFFFFPNTATCLIIWLSNQCVLESALLSDTPSSDWSVGALGLSPAEPDRPEQTGVRLLTLLRVRGTLHCWWETDTWERHLDLCNILVWANSSHQGLCQILYQINVETPKGLWDMSSYSKTKAKSQKVTKELE